MSVSYHFPPRLRAASVVSRWSIVWTTEKDTVSSHSFFVAVYAKQIADMLAIDKRLYGRLLWLCLTHDMEEVITGDLVSPVKREITDASSINKFVTKKASEVLPFLFADMVKEPTSIDYTCLSILKAADALDAVLFAMSEKMRGNSAIASRIPSCMDRLTLAWNQIEASSILKAKRWPVVLAAIQDHSDPRNYDIDSPADSYPDKDAIYDPTEVAPAEDDVPFFSELTQ